MAAGDSLEGIVTLAQLRAWTSSTKVALTSIDDDMMKMIVAEVFGKLGSRYNTRPWVSLVTTPVVVQKIICMRYVGWYYLKQFAETDSENAYGVRLLLEAEELLTEVLTGEMILTDGEIDVVTAAGLSFEPAESEPVFVMDKVW